MVISSFISSVLLLALGTWAYMKLDSSVNIVAEKQLLIEPSRLSYKMWKDMPVTMYQSFTFFNLTNWNQVKSIGQKPKFVEVGPYVYRTMWTKSDVNFLDEEKLVSFAERKQWIFQPHLSKGSEDDQIWTINTPLMTALALIQNAPVITRNIVSVILDGLGEGAFIKRNIRSLLFEGYSDLIVSVGPLFDRRFSNFNGKFAYLYNKNDSVDGVWTVSTGAEDLASLNKVYKFQSSIVNMTRSSSGQPPQGLNEVKPECAAAWSLDQSTNGQLFSPFNPTDEQSWILKQQQHQSQSQTVSKPKSRSDPSRSDLNPVQSKRFFSRSASSNHDHQHSNQQQDLVLNPFMNPSSQQAAAASLIAHGDKLKLRDMGKYIFYPDLCRPLHLLPGKQKVLTSDGIQANRYYIDPRVFMNSTQVPTNRCYEMNPRPPLANALAATINSVTGANVQVPNLVAGASSPFAMFSPPAIHHGDNNGGLFERSNHPSSFLNNALHSLGANNQNQQASSNSNAPVSRLSRVRQLFSNIVSQRMSASPGSLLPSLATGPASVLLGNHFGSSTARNSPDEPAPPSMASMARHNVVPHQRNLDGVPQGSNAVPIQATPTGGSDRWITQFRFKWPKGVFSIGQCQLGAPIYASLPHFLDADEYYLEQVDGLKPNRSLHEFYIDVESTLHSIPVGAKARLQLNVATPELRFRNIPNAMIPVLWQEVTFDIEKPVATMLYWLFTMSSTICKLVSILLLATGIGSLVGSFVVIYRKHRSKGRVSGEGGSGRDVRRITSSSLDRVVEGQRSSWQPHMIRRHHGVQGAAKRAHISHLESHSDNLDDIRQGGALNHAFSSCTEFHDRLSDNGRQTHSASGPSSSNSNGSPKQPSSRASSHCELVSSVGTTVNCAGCLLACLRHSPNTIGSSHIHEHHLVAPNASDNRIVRQQVTTSDIDKATL